MEELLRLMNTMASNILNSQMTDSMDSAQYQVYIQENGCLIDDHITCGIYVEKTALELENS